MDLTINGKPAPPFCLPDQDDVEHCLDRYRGKWLVLYFYPKDNTSGCSTEALDFTFFREQFAAIDAVILGVSPDSVKSHQNFCRKRSLSITLLSDSSLSTLKAYGVWQTKKMYGKEYQGVVRSTFLIDPRGLIRQSWTKVKVTGHVEAVLATLKELQLADAGN